MRSAMPQRFGWVASTPRMDTGIPRFTMERSSRLRLKGRVSWILRIWAGFCRPTRSAYGARARSGRASEDASTLNPPTTDWQGGGLDPNIAGDDNHNALVGFNLGYDFSGFLDGLRLAVHWLQGDINAYSIDSTTITNDLKNNILSTTTLNAGGGSLVYLTNDWEIMGEYYGFIDKDKYVATGLNEGNKYKSRAGYLQVGFNIDAWTPYVRFERTILDQNDNYFNTQANGQSYARQALGIRYNIDPKACLKLALMNSHFMTEPGRTSLSYRSVNLQYAIGF
jgi:hypothetical protein